MSNVLQSPADNQRVHRTGVANGLQSTGQGNVSYSIEYFDDWSRGRTGMDVGVHNHPRGYSLHGAGAVQAVFYEFETAVAACQEVAKAEAQAGIPSNNPAADRTTINADQEVRSGN